MWSEAVETGFRFREGDIIGTAANIFFDVKGLVHPPSRIIAFPRFIPDLKGSRYHEDTSYRKVYGISERFRFLEKNLPNYIVYDAVFDEKLCEVPLEDIKRRYVPKERLKEIRSSRSQDALESDALEFMETLKNSANVPWNVMGIAGSLLIKLHLPESDIDPIIYGSVNCFKVHDALESLMQDSGSNVRAYPNEDLLKLYDFRVKDTRTSFENFVRAESRKVLQGKFREREFLFAL